MCAGNAQQMPRCLPGACEDSLCQQCTRQCRDNTLRLGASGYCTPGCRCGRGVGGCRTSAACLRDERSGEPMVCCQGAHVHFWGNQDAPFNELATVCLPAVECLDWRGRSIESAREREESDYSDSTFHLFIEVLH